MSLKPKFIYFDVGNIFHTTDLVFTTAAKDFNLSPDSLNDLYEEYQADLIIGKVSIEDFWQICCQRLKISNGQDYDFAKAWVNDYVVIPQMHQLAKKLSQIYKVGLLSNHFLNALEKAAKLGKTPNILFEPIINSAEVSCRKPDLQIYKIAEDRSGFKGQEIFFIDDKQRNLDVAIFLGWQTFLFDYKNPDKSAKELENILTS